MCDVDIQKLRQWLDAEYDQAREAARIARQYRNAEGNPHALEFVSATARICALGQVRARLKPAPLPGSDAPMTPQGRRGDL